MPSELNTSPSDRDYTIRTMIGEAGNQSDDGMAGVASVIQNRARSGNYGGSTARDVVLAPGQFEPWQTRGRELMGYSEDSPEYKRAASVYDRVASGETPDPTGGATHFLNEKIVRERRGGKLPDWATGQGTRIGDHTFYSPDKQGDTGLFDKYDPDAPKPAAAAAAGRGELPLLDKYDRPDVEIGGGGKPTRITVRPPEARGDVANMSGFNNRMVSSIPIVGPAFDAATAAVGAGIQGINAQPGGLSFSERYANNRLMQDQLNDQYGRDHSVLGPVADATGAAMLLGPISKTKAGASALGITGTSLGTQVLKGAGTMGAIETANQLAKGNDPRDQGLFGPVPMAVASGVAGPVLGDAAKVVGNKLVELTPPSSGPLRGTNSVTRNRLSEAVSHETPASIAAAKTAHGQAGLMMDTNQATRDIAGGLADIPGQAKGDIRETLRLRAQGQADRLRQSLDHNTVPQVNTADLVRTVNDYRDQAAKPLYDAFRKTKIYPTPEIQALVPRLEAAGAFKMADELAGIRGTTGTEKFFVGGPQKEFPSAETWDLVKRGLDRRISSALDGSDKTLARELLQLKHDMLTEVEKTEGGKIWKQARQTFAEHSEITHQIEEGQKTWNRTSRVDDLAQELRGLSDPERAARVQGARDAIHEVMTNTINGDTTARNKLLTEAGRQKIELLFGQQRGGRLIRDLEAEVNISHNTNEIVGGSPTATKQARRDALLPQKREPGYFANVDLTRPSTMIPDWMHPSAMMEGVSEARHARSRDELGRLMRTPMHSPAYDDLVAAMSAEGARRSAGSAVAARRGGAVAGATQATAPALGNRLSRPQNSEPELEGSRL